MAADEVAADTDDVKREPGMVVATVVVAETDGSERETVMVGSVAVQVKVGAGTAAGTTFGVMG